MFLYDDSYMSYSSEQEEDDFARFLDISAAC